MALLFMESCDGYGGTASHATKWASINLATSSPAPRTGSHRLSTSSNHRAISPATATVIIGFAFYWNGASQGSCQLWADAGFSVATQCGFSLDSDGKVSIRRGNATGGTLLATSASAVLVSGSWNFIEAKILVDNSGSWTIKVNGAEVLTGSGDTQQSTTNAIGGITYATGTGNGIDDLYVLDSSGSALNDFIGDCKVECLTPQTGNGSNVGLTPLSGTDHGAMVDELPGDDDTTYNFGTTAGVKDTYNFPSLATTGVVKGVQVTARARKTDSATKELALVARLGGADYDGATQAVAATTYGQYQQLWEKRPSDSADWTIADVNGAEFGLKVVS